MSNGIQSLQGPDKKKRNFIGPPLSYGHKGTYQGSFPKRLSPEAWKELVGDFPRYRSQDVVQSDPRRLLPTADSVIAFFKNISPDQPIPQIMDEEESIQELRDLNRERGAADLRESGRQGHYIQKTGHPDDNKIYIQPHQMYDVGMYRGQPEGLDPGRSVMVHELMHFLQRMLKANPDLYGDSPRGLVTLQYPFSGDLHGPKSMTANTLEAAWDALSSVESAPGIANIEHVVDHIVENFPEYDSSTRYQRSIARKDAEDTARWMAPYHTSNKTLQEQPIGPPYPKVRRTWNAGDYKDWERWLAEWGEKTGMSYDPDNPVYDYRAAYEADAEPLLIPEREDDDYPTEPWKGTPYAKEPEHYHWPSRYKKEGHPTEGAGEGIRGLLLGMKQRADAQKRRQGIELTDDEKAMSSLWLSMLQKAGKN